MKKFLAVPLVIVLLTGCGESGTVERAEPENKVTAKERMTTEKATEKAAPKKKIEKSAEKGLAFLDDFTEYGYSEEQIKAMKTILANVGIKKVMDPEIGPVSYGMQMVKGVAFRDKSIGGGGKEVQVRFNIENGVLYAVNIYCPSYQTASQPAYLSGLQDRRAELYYDAKGGYLKKIDWKKKAVVEY